MPRTLVKACGNQVLHIQLRVIPPIARSFAKAEYRAAIESSGPSTQLIFAVSQDYKELRLDLAANVLASVHLGVTCTTNPLKVVSPGRNQPRSGLNQLDWSLPPGYRFLQIDEAAGCARLMPRSEAVQRSDPYEMNFTKHSWTFIKRWLGRSSELSSPEAAGLETGSGQGSRAAGRRTLGTVIAILSSMMALGGVAVSLFRDSLLRPSEHIVLSIQGSTTLGDELMPKLAQAFLRDEMRASRTGIRVAERDARGHSRLYVWGTIPGRSGRQVIEIYPSESSTAFQCLGARSRGRNCDIGMASRPINSHDEDTYPILRNIAGRLTEHVVALDAIAVIVNPKNPVSELSIPQLRGIYSGQITNWRGVGGLDAPIVFYGRDGASGTFEMFTEKVFGKDATTNGSNSAVPPERQIADSGLVVDAVMRSTNAIGYVSLPMIRDAKTIAVSDGSGPALRPTELSIVTEDYPICRRLILYDWDAPGSLKNAFVRYVVYKPGQTLVTQTPFLELTPKILPAVPPPNAPPAYKQIAAHFSRIGLSFHFSSEQIDPAADADSRLDNLARVNVLRLRTFLSQHNRTGSDILLLGFGDNSESGLVGQKLAKTRAEAVATSLRAIGVIVPSENIRGFGGEVPVASNDTAEGRRKNRRVEVWVHNDE